MGINKGVHRYLVKFKIIGVPGNFWTDLMLWDVHEKPIRVVLDKAIEQAQHDAGVRFKKKFKSEEVDIISFSLIDYEEH